MGDFSLDTYQLELTFKTHNINYDKIFLYHDFIVTLDDLVNTTFLGIDVIYTYQDMHNHFSWCFDKVITLFEYESIFFNRRSKLFKYLWSFYYDAFYMTLIEGGENKVGNFFKILFDMRIKKTRPELKIFIDVYFLFEESLKKK